MARTLHTVILAGGSGTRFWPLSRELNPKQMLTEFGGESLLISTIERAFDVMSSEGRVYLVVGEALADEIKNHVKASSVDDSRIDYIIEPLQRNTGPALAYAAAVVELADPAGIVLMLPSDHICESDEEWKKAVAAALIRAHAGDLVTIGLEPKYPATGFGYIRKGESILSATPGKHNEVFKAAEFVEKPDENRAIQYIDSGEYFWNSGMLVARCDVLLHEFLKVTSRHPNNDIEDVLHSGQMALTARTIAEAGPEAYKIPVMAHIFGALPSIPFDKAVLEYSDNVSVVPANLVWSDVGSLDALEGLTTPDEAGNYLIGNVIDVDSKGILSFSKASPYAEARLVATLGLNNVMVVDTPDATLVADRSRAQDVRLVVEALKEAGAPELVSSRSSKRPWGSWTTLVKSEGFQVKEVDVLPGTRLSLQSHEKRAEHWIVIEGEATVTRGNEEFVLKANESIFLPMGEKHRLENKGDTTLRIVEVATGSYLGEDDITRFDDDYGR